MTIEQFQSIKRNEVSLCIFTASVYLVAREQGNSYMPPVLEVMGIFNREVSEQAVASLLAKKQELADRVAAFIHNEVLQGHG